MMITGWARPAAIGDEDKKFEVLYRLLGDGQTSRLVDRLVVREKLAGSVKIWSTTPGDKLSSEFAIFIDVFDAASYNKIENIIQEELDRLAKEGPTENELKKIKNRYAAELIQALQKNAGMADALSYYDLLLGDYHRMFTALEEIESVNAVQIQELIKKYFIPAQNTTVYINPIQ
ncbi:MAG TPA: insulinase family protein, partial [Turneriella sp.]|nr:insulinase family protein [Turneriella sp.]